MIMEVVALLMIIDGEIKEHRIQVDPKTGKYSMAMCLKGKRHATRGEKKYNKDKIGEWIHIDGVVADKFKIEKMKELFLLPLEISKMFEWRNI